MNDRLKIAAQMMAAMLPETRTGTAKDQEFYSVKVVARAMAENAFILADALIAEYRCPHCGENPTLIVKHGKNCHADNSPF